MNTLAHPVSKGPKDIAGIRSEIACEDSATAATVQGWGNGEPISATFTTGMIKQQDYCQNGYLELAINVRNTHFPLFAAGSLSTPAFSSTAFAPMPERSRMHGEPKEPADTTTRRLARATMTVLAAFGNARGL